MSSLIPAGSASGTGSMTLAAPVTNSNQTATLPDATGTIVVSGANSAITSGTAVASTSGTSIDFTGIPSWVKRVTVMFNGVSTNGTSQIQIQVGNGSIVTSGYVSGSWTSNTSNNNSTTGFMITGVNAAAAYYYGNAFICLQTNNTWIESHTIGSPQTYNSIGGGSITLGGTLDRVRITTFTGTDTFDAGSINILWE
jgi:hypothetical protein